jgi:hypothetical protein
VELAPKALAGSSPLDSGACAAPALDDDDADDDVDADWEELDAAACPDVPPAQPATSALVAAPVNRIPASRRGRVGAAVFIAGT